MHNKNRKETYARIKFAFNINNRTLYTYQNKFCITSVPQLPEPLHTNEIEIHTNTISALFIANENHILHGVPSYR